MRDIKVVYALADANVDAHVVATAAVLAVAIVFLFRNHGVNLMPAIKVSRVLACASVAVIAGAFANVCVTAVATVIA
jgi:hypothetical protein